MRRAVEIAVGVGRVAESGAPKIAPYPEGAVLVNDTG